MQGLAKFDRFGISQRDGFRADYFELTLGRWRRKCCESRRVITLKRLVEVSFRFVAVSGSAASVGTAAALNALNDVHSSARARMWGLRCRQPNE